MFLQRISRTNLTTCIARRFHSPGTDRIRTAQRCGWDHRASARSAEVLLLLCLGGGICTFGIESQATCEEDRLEAWRQRWKAGRTTWHRNGPNNVLLEHYDRFLGDGEGTDVKTEGRTTEQHRTLVPLCGKTLDMPFLAEKGHEVVGVDGVEAAAFQLQRDSWLNFRSSNLTVPPPDGNSKSSAHYIAATTFEGERPGYVFKTGDEGLGYYRDNISIKIFQDTRQPLTFIVGDFLDMRPDVIGTFDRLWDRGSLVAIQPEEREAYLAVCDSLLDPGGQVLLTTMDYDQDLIKGPPYSLPLKEVKCLYGQGLGYKVELLSRHNEQEEYKGGKWSAIPANGLHECAFLLTKPGGRKKSFWSWLWIFG
ncbi:unnamed protein product [Choristocarpus tenellus]